MVSSDEGWVRKLSMVCLHNNAIVARGILVTILHCGTPEPRLSAIYIVSIVGTSFNAIMLALSEKLGRKCIVASESIREPGSRCV